MLKKITWFWVSVLLQHRVGWDRSLGSHIWAWRICAAQQGMLFASLSLKQGIEITLFLWKRVSFALDLTLEQGRLFPEFWLITNHKRFKRRKWLSKKLIVYEWITVWNWVPIFTIFVWTRVANTSFFFLWEQIPPRTVALSPRRISSAAARTTWNEATIEMMLLI